MFNHEHGKSCYHCAFLWVSMIEKQSIRHLKTLFQEVSTILQLYRLESNRRTGYRSSDRNDLPS